jgi:hypothetical protein
LFVLLLFLKNERNTMLNNRVHALNNVPVFMYVFIMEEFNMIKLLIRRAFFYTIFAVYAINCSTSDRRLGRPVMPEEGRPDAKEQSARNPLGAAAAASAAAPSTAQAPRITDSKITVALLTPTIIGDQDIKAGFIPRENTGYMAARYGFVRYIIPSQKVPPNNETVVFAHHEDQESKTYSFSSLAVAQAFVRIRLQTENKGPCSSCFCC